jgi:hypothetical protein
VTSILALTLALVSSNPDCYLCPTEPPPVIYHEPFECKEGLAKVRCESGWRCVPTELVPEPVRSSYRVQVEPTPFREPPLVLDGPYDEPLAWTVLGEAGGAATCPCSNSGGVVGLLGVRGRDGWLGAQLHTLFNHGLGGDVLVYPLVLDGLRLHVNAGLLWHNGDPVTAPGWDRTWDWSVGAGVELPLSKRLDLVGDARCFAPVGYRINSTSVEQTLLLGGLLLRF